MHEEFLCEVTAYGVCGGQQVGVPLGTYRAPSLPLAMWWLRERATWIAERLDPVPEQGRIPAGALVPLPRDAPDVPGVLRAWRDSGPDQEQAAVDLASGRLVRFIARDDTTEYELLAESVDMIRIQRVLGGQARPAAPAAQGLPAIPTPAGPVLEPVPPPGLVRPQAPRPAPAPAPAPAWASPWAPPM